MRNVKQWKSNKLTIVTSELKPQHPEVPSFNNVIKLLLPQCLPARLNGTNGKHFALKNVALPHPRFSW